MEQRFSFGDIQKYTDIFFQSASRMQFFGVKKWYNRNVFSDTKLKYVCWKTCKVRKVFDWCGSTSFSTSSELRFVKWVKFFVRNCIVKWVIFFASFCWLWDFLLENLKIKEKLWWCPLERVDKYKSVACLE